MTHTARLDRRLRDTDDVPAGHYARAHTLRFDGGATVPVSASPDLVGRWADPAAIDPEEMLVASLSSCHMPWFLHMARLGGLLPVPTATTPWARWPTSRPTGRP